MSGANGLQGGLTRRNFLKTTAAVAGVAAVAGTVGAAPPVLIALAEESEEKSESKVVPGRCFFGGCFSCEYLVTVRDGHAVKVTPDPDEPYGRRPCLRALSQIQRLYSNERIKYPMKRAGERGENRWERISWDEAIATITDKWKGYREQYGPKSIAVSQGTGAARHLSLVRNRMAGILEMPAIDLSVDWAFYTGLHRVCGDPSPKNMTSPGNEPPEEDIFNAKRIIIWGHNFSEAYVQRWRYIMEAQERGAEVIAIDPNQTLTASRADRWYTPRPGSDTALMLSMVQVVIEEGLQDTSFLLSDTVGPFLVRDDTKKFLRMSDLGVEPTQGPVSATTGKPTIIDPPIVWDSATGKPASSKEVAVPALEGQWVVEGIKVKTAYSHLVDHVQEYAPEAIAEMVDMDPSEIRELAHLSVDGPVSHVAGMGSQAYVNGFGIGSGLGTLLAVTGMLGKPGAGCSGGVYPVPLKSSFLFPTGTFTTTISVLEAANVIKTGTYAGKEYPPIKSLFISSCGIVGSAVNLNSILSDIIDQVEFIVCADLSFTDSARHADIVLPVAYTYEIEDIYSIPLTADVQYLNRIVEPAFEAKPDEEICKLLAQGMDIGSYFEGTSESWLRELLDVPDLKRQNITLETLREKHSIRFTPKGTAFEDGVYATPTGKVEFYCENPIPRIEFGQERNIDTEHLPRFFPPYEAWPDTEAMKKYPLQLISERSRNRWHVQGFDGVWLNEISPEPTIRINPDDAEARGIEDGDYIEVYNDRGHGVAKAYRCAGMRPGMMSYPKGWQSHQYKAGNFSQLTHSHYEPFGISSAFFDTCVEIRKWNGGE